jgi:chaperonin GroES
MKLKPMGDQVLLKRQKNQEKTKSGIILTSGISNYETADVIEVGTGLFTQTGDKIPTALKEGDQVLLHSRLLKGDNEVEIEGKKYLIVRESELTMVSRN